MLWSDSGTTGPSAGTPRSVPDPFWYKDAVIYQIHVKAFADSDDDGIGDFRGLLTRLPYVRSLGASALWLLPFFPSPLRDDGYDVAEYCGVHPAYGNLDDVRRFIAEAHDQGLRVITDFVLNHTSDQHAWFQRARQAPAGSNERDFYVWSDSPEKFSETRIIFTDTENSNWAWDPVARAYYWHRFFSHQPDLNYDNPNVFDAVVDAMRFWFDAGVDALRLDAVPYLCEREGTNNENLPETHAILRRLRAIVDAEYPDRCLLAEANQWPEDVRAYFGEGDECHMAFHFPLMPRLFMSIAAEDRYPVYDIVRQTPAIPENCQWAIFLRNHDEMTLEMVSDRERAFMYDVYASETRARVNVGIRRRLAPLMENDRRKIELMTSLLLSMPGTPVLYYGDEIGMGDNIYLGDRDGVRTPMQWSGDRNGGFSRADTQRLYLPAIMDPVYGYAAVNVEAQERSPSSMLHWVRKQVALRQSSAVFGRGSIAFLYPQNRKIAAYVREYEGETMLCVANLSRAPQAVALELGRFAGQTPIEMSAGNPFPPILSEPYRLTLAGHAFFWFRLVDAANAIVSMSDEAAPTGARELFTVVVPRGWRSLAEPAARRILENDVVPQLIDERFAAGVAPHTTPLIDIIAVDESNSPPLLGIFDARGRAAQSGFAIVPMQISFETVTDRTAIARARSGFREGTLVDPTHEHSFWSDLVRIMREGISISSGMGRLSGRPTWSWNGLTPADLDVRRLTTRSVDTSAILGEHLIARLFRRSAGDLHPAIEIGRALHEIGFTHTPPLLGTLEYETIDGASIGIGSAHRFVLNRGDGLDVFIAHVAAVASGELSADADLPQVVGSRLAALHHALAVEVGTPSFAAEPIGEDDLRAWRPLALNAVEMLLASLRREASTLPELIREDAVRLAKRGDDLRRRAEPPHALLGTPKIRVHGDFHLGRLLVTEHDVLIVDAGIGSETRTPEELRGKASPLEDVAAMIGSLPYAPAAVFLSGSESLKDVKLSEEDARTWTRDAIDRFLGAYLAGIAGSTLAPTPDIGPLLEFFMLRKLCESIVSELAQRPPWAIVPMRLLERVLNGDGFWRSQGP